MIPSLPIGGATAPADGKEPEDIPAIRLLVKQRPDVLALAEVVSPAVYVEPALLRTARYRLLPHLGAEAEAGLWFGPLTTPTRSGLVFMASALPSLRRRLAADPERFEAAANLVSEIHADAAPSVRLEEEIIRLSLSGSPDSVLEERLTMVAAAMVQQPHRATDIARWLMLALPRLPDRARRSPTAWALSLRAAEQLGSPAPLREPPALDLGRWRAFASVQRPGGSPTSVHLLRDGLRIGAAAGPEDHVIAVPPTSPRFLEVGVAETTMTPVSFREGEQRNVPVSTLQVWSDTTGELRLSWTDRITAVAAAASGDSVAVGFAEGRVELRDTRTGALRGQRDVGGPITGLAMAGSRVLIGTVDGLGIWDAERNTHNLLLLQDEPVAALAAPAGGRYVVAAAGSHLAVYELPGGHRMATDSFQDEVTAVAAPGELIIAVVGGAIYVTDPHLGQVRELTSSVRAERIAALSDYQIAVLGSDGQVRGWQVSSGEPLGIVARGAGPVVDIAASGGKLVTAGTDRLLREWTGPDLGRQSGQQELTVSSRSAGLIISGFQDTPLHYEGQLQALTGAASPGLLIASGSWGGPLTLRSFAGDAWRLEPAVAADGPLGALADGEGTRFAVFSSVADAVELCLFEDGGETRVHLVSTGDGIWQGYLPGVQPGQLYGYRAHGPYDPAQGLRCNPAKLLLDPYGKAIDGELEWDEALFGHDITDPLAMNRSDSAPFMPKNVVIAPSFDWGDDRPPRTPYHETVIYEAHVRGLTLHHPGVPPDQRGTYLGLAHPAVIEHLSRLGITAVELMPVHQFVSDQFLVSRGLTNYWGYNTIGFLAPHNAYSASSRRGGQVDEFKTMVKALHEAGIEVILDVVYNHTAEGNHLGPTLSFRGIDNVAYYRLVDDDRRYYIDTTGTGNSLDMASPRVLQLILESLRYWVSDMHVDGFRFDLAATLARQLHERDRLRVFLDLIQQDPVLSQVKLIGEPWDIGSGGYQVGKFPPLWSEWNGRYRDAVRDFWRGRPNRLAEFRTSLSGSSDLYGASEQRPAVSVNYVTSHDGFTLNDLVSYDHKHNEANGEDNHDGSDDNRSWNCGVEGPTDDSAVLALRAGQQRNFLATLLLSKGVPMLLAGDELGRTQRGNNNAYCQDNEISWLDWTGSPPNGLAELIARLTRIRREYPVLQSVPVFSGTSADDSDIVWLDPGGTPLTETNRDDNMLAVAAYLRGEPPKAPRQPGSPLLLLLNAYWEAITFTLPGTEFVDGWKILINTAVAETPSQSVPTQSGQFTVAARSLVLMTAESAAASVPESAATPVAEAGVAETEYAVETE